MAKRSNNIPPRVLLVSSYTCKKNELILAISSIYHSNSHMRSLTYRHRLRSSVPQLSPLQYVSKV